MSAQVAADLRTAADVLERDGWCQFRAHDGGGHCVAGAVEVAVDPDWQQEGLGWEADQNARFGAAMTAVADLIGVKSPYRMTKWNDDLERTADEVIAALRAAADAAEAQS